MSRRRTDRHARFTEYLILAAWSFAAGLALLAAYLIGPSIAQGSQSECWDARTVLDAGTKPRVHQLIDGRGHRIDWRNGDNYARSYAHDLTVVYRHRAHHADPALYVDSCGWTVARGGK